MTELGRSGAAPALACLFDEDRVVVVDKPAGLTSEDAARTVGRKLVHRIDKATSGLLLLAVDARTVQRLQRALREGRVERTYLFIAHGRVGDGVVQSELVRDRGDGRRGSGPGGKRAVTRLRALSYLDGGAGVVTRGEAQLVTGRTHQVRIHLAEGGHPILGERVYAAYDGAPRLMLHAHRLCFVHPGTKAVVEVASPAPAAFGAFAGA